MGWQDYHLWEFEADERRYGLPDPGWPDDTLAAAKNTKLKTLIDRGIRQLDYTYDMGDNWHHSIIIEAVGPGQPDTKYPRYIDGARRCPPEDCGGTPGFENFLEAIANPKHPDHAELIKWYDGCYGGAYQPNTIDELIAKRRVALEEFTNKVAATVVSTGERRALEPMNAADRKVVHDAVAKISGVASMSEGEDPDRRVVLVPE